MYNFKSIIQQCAGDLGKKLQHCSKEQSKKYNKHVIIGSDCPVISSSYIFDAFKSLDSHDLALGPAEDGGYVLIGQTKANLKVFNDIDWSTSLVFQQTMVKANDLKLKTNKLATLWDIDTAKDYDRYKLTLKEESTVS